MKIISNYKDYYDYLSLRYGGDPKIVYVRPHRNASFFACDIKKLDKIHSIPKLHALMRGLRYHGKNNYETPNIRGIVVGNILFTQIREDGKYRLLNEKDIINYRTTFYYRTKYKIGDFINCIDNTLIDFCKIIKLPVFSFDVAENIISMDEYCPRLGKIGIASFIDSNKMYQHLSYFVGNLMHDSPDSMPNIEFDNKDKIISHGFDYVTSFRGK